MASGRLDLNPLGGAAGTVYAVEVDGHPVGAVVLTDAGWVAARQGWQDHQPRTRRRAAVRRLLMSHPAGTFGVRPANLRPGGTPDD